VTRRSLWRYWEPDAESRDPVVDPAAVVRQMAAAMGVAAAHVNAAIEAFMLQGPGAELLDALNRLGVMEAPQVGESRPRMEPWPRVLGVLARLTSSIPKSRATRRLQHPSARGPPHRTPFRGVMRARGPALAAGPLFLPLPACASIVEPYSGIAVGLGQP
jgi:hypothetical protein